VVWQFVAARYALWASTTEFGYPKKTPHKAAFGDCFFLFQAQPTIIKASPQGRFLVMPCGITQVAPQEYFLVMPCGITQGVPPGDFL
jgi:hypothetical protein